MKKKLLVLLVFLLPVIIYSKELNLKITDKDLDIPLEGVKVHINQFDNNYFTNEDGQIKLQIDDSIERVIITCSMAGYEIKKMNIKDFDIEHDINMVLEGMLEGEELVIEDSYYKAKEEVGKSLVVDKEELKATAMKGTVEDVISSVKTMPGVSYSSNFMTDLSIRGSDSDEIVASYDGFIVRNPFYWGSAVSMFNPNIVDSAKFNNGYFSVKNGHAMSGLLDVNVKTPDEGFKIDTKLAYSTFETIIQTPMGLGDKMGFLGSGRATYLELTVLPIWKAMGLNVVQVPYIYDGNLKWFWKPNERFEWYINGYIGADGAGFGDVKEDSKGIDTEEVFVDKNLHSIGFTGFKIMPIDRIIINWLGGYEFQYQTNNFDGKSKGEKDYSSDFKKRYGITDDSFTVNYKEKQRYIQTTHSIQTRLDTEYELHKRVIMSIGADLIYDFDKGKYNHEYYDFDKDDKVTESTDYGSLFMFNNGGYLNFNFYPVPDKLEIELGVRLSHFIAKKGSEILNTYPVANPRFYIAYTPYRGKYLEYFTMSYGVGLFSHMPSYYYDQNYSIPSLGIQQEKVLTNVIGFEFMLPLKLNLKVESYFKYYFDKYYANATYNEDYVRELHHHSNGYGYAAGFDVILKRKISRYIDGWISYSFIYAKYYNPISNGQDYTYDSNEPTKQWYYPQFHRWHSMNLVLNVKPTNWLTISPNFGVHSGLPKRDIDVKDKTVPRSTGGDIMEVYEWDVNYNDTNRTLPSLPFGLKITFHYFFPRSKLGFEAYASFDNLFSFFWTPDSREFVDKYTGDILKSEGSAYEVFLPSFGLKITY